MGTLPDLDVLPGLLMSPAQALHFHRGPTHSLFFAFVAAPVLGWLVSRLYRARRPALASPGPWIGAAFLALWTHPMLDFFTIYGTQLLWPFTDHPFALGSVFIVDPVYSVPLFVAVGVAFFRRRAWPVPAALVWSTLYLAWGVGAQAWATRAIADGLGRQGVATGRLLVTASPFNTVLWYGIARTDSLFVATTYSLLDGDRGLTLRFVPRRAHLERPLRHEPAVQTLRWFTQGWASWQQRPDGLHLRDVRFGRADGWLSDEDDGYVFDFHLVPGAEGRYTFTQVPPDFDLGAALPALLRRIGGEEPQALVPGAEMASPSPLPLLP